MTTEHIILYNYEKKKLESFKYSSDILFDIYKEKLGVPSVKTISIQLNEYYKNKNKNSKNLLNKAERIQTKIKKKLSKIEDYLPLYEPISKFIYLIAKENVYNRVTFQFYRIPSDTLVGEIQKTPGKEGQEDERIKKNLRIILNYHLETLEVTYLRVFYYFANEVGKNITTCLSPSFVPELTHIKPYYNRSELINLALNMKLITPDKTYYDIKKVEELCHKVQENDVSHQVILLHKNYIINNSAVQLVQHYTFNGSYSFNNYLRAPNNSAFYNEIVQSNIRIIWDLCLNSPLFDKEYTIYRFVSADSFLNGIKINDIFVDPGFISATRNPFYRSDYYQFGFILIKIKLPKNRKGTALCIESFSHFPEEEEMLLPPYTQLRLINRDNNFEFFHIDDKFKSRIIKKYEFEYVGQERTIFEDKYISLEKNKDSNEKNNSINFLNISLHGPTLKSRLSEFQKTYANEINQFKVKIGKLDLTLIIENYDSSSAYKNLYAMQNKFGYSIYSFYKKTILFFIEIFEQQKEIHVNYYFRKSESSDYSSLINESDFIKFISSLSYMFKIQRIVLYTNYKFCRTKDDKINNGSNFCLDFYQYLNYGKKRFADFKEIKSKFEYIQLDKLKNISAKTIVSIKDRDEIYQIYINSKDANITVAEFYVYLVKHNCSLIKLLEKKIERIFPGLSSLYNPFLYDYYHVDPNLFLLNNNLISSLPIIDTEISESVGETNIISFNEIDKASSQGLRIRI